MAVLTRLFSQSLDTWLARRERRPLIVRGARQVGKSHVIMSWAKATFSADKILVINLESSPRLRTIFDGELTADAMLSQINLLTGFNLRDSGTLLFIDEIQAAPKAINALRFFYEQHPALPVIAAGSLLEFALEKHGVPVGRVEYLYLFPLSFREFLSALGKQSLADHINTISLDSPLPDAIHLELLEKLGLYLRIGGMPKVVSTYIDTLDIAQVAREQRLILSTYEEDFPKYARKSQLEGLDRLFQRIPRFIAKQRVQYSKIEGHEPSTKVKRTLQLLIQAHILSPVLCSLAKKPPLAAEAKDRFFKLLFLDIGLLQHAYGFDWQRISPSADLSTVADGVFAEQFVGQQLVAEQNPQSPTPLYYWDRNEAGSDAEVDYLIEHMGEIAPLEIKSGKQGSLRSLHIFLTERKSPHAFVLSQRNIERHGAIHWLPLYLAGRLVRRVC